MANLEESPIKHTAGGFVPETRPLGVLKRRLQADEAVLGERSVWMRIAVPVAIAGLAVGAYLLLGRWAARREEAESGYSDWAA